MTTNKYLLKIAYQLEDHQSRTVDKLFSSGGVLAAHSMGSGKTLTALESIRRLKEEKGSINALMIVPASLISNVWKEVEKHEMDITPEDLQVISYNKAVNEESNLASKKWDVVVLDEAHSIRNPDTKKSQIVRKILNNADKRLLLTGTPSYNRPEDLGILLKMTAGEGRNIPTGREFKETFIRETEVKPGFFGRLIGVKPGVETSLQNTRLLKKILQDNVDYHDARQSSEDLFPEVERDIVKVDMSKEQKKVYNYLEGEIPLLTRIKIRAGLPPSKQESRDLNAYLAGVRQASNSIVPYKKNADDPKIRYSPKMKAALDRVLSQKAEDENFRSVLYSNYLAAGQDLMQELLEGKGIVSEKFHGGLTKKEKQDIVRRYNEGEIDTLLLSSSGSEGLDLKGTKLMQVLEPHFNQSKINQVVARGDRYMSHSHLPEDERKMKVEYYQSTLPVSKLRTLLGSKKPVAVDEYLHGLSEKKESINQAIIDLMR